MSLKGAGLVASLCLLVAGLCAAQTENDKPAASGSKSQAAASGVVATPASEAVPTPEAKPETPAPAPKPLEACAAKAQPVVDAYQQAHDEFSAWLRGASDKMDAAEAGIDGLKSQIADKEAAITKLKLDSATPGDPRMQELEGQSKALWSQLKAEQAHKAELCRALARAAQQKVRELNRAVSDAAAKLTP